MTTITGTNLKLSKNGYRRAIGLGLFLVLFFWIQFAEGQRRNDPPALGGASDAQRASKGSMSGKSVAFDQTKLRASDTSSLETFRRSIVNSALSYDIPTDLSGEDEKNYEEKETKEEKELSFPGFPRVWTELSMENYSGVSAYASASVPVPFLGAITYGLKVNKNYKYSVKTTFILVASDSSDHSKYSDQPKVRQVSEDEDNFLVLNHQTMHAYPKVSDENPMVGLCSYDISLSNEFQTQDGFSFNKAVGALAAAVGLTWEKGTVEVAKTTRFSKFIRLDPTISIDQYLRTVCMEKFSESKRRETASHFNKIVLSQMWHHNPNSTCTPSLDNFKERLPGGDRSCMEWYSDNFDSSLRKRTIPRCEIHADGTHRCVLKSRENATCPMFLDRKTGTYSPFLSQKNRVSVTSGAYERPCDDTSGLKCQFVDQPSMFALGIPLLMGSARCSR
ncbi:MAG: hypothetical protein IPL83_09710 [Bdellovibrionales bacterium]|nr:hypothetical protein [Bdellovibrionales bacterium]